MSASVETAPAPEFTYVSDDLTRSQLLNMLETVRGCLLETQRELEVVRDYVGNLLDGHIVELLDSMIVYAGVTCRSIHVEVSPNDSVCDGDSDPSWRWSK